jgi:hypothetical protein
MLIDATRIEDPRVVRFLNDKPHNKLFFGGDVERLNRIGKITSRLFTSVISSAKKIQNKTALNFLQAKASEPVCRLAPSIANPLELAELFFLSQS